MFLFRRMRRNDVAHIGVSPELVDFSTQSNKKLGSGGFSTVFKGVLSDDQEVAVKVAKSGADSSDCLRNEMSALTKVGVHEHIIHLINASVPKRNMLVLELAQQDLYDYVDSKGGLISEDEARAYFAQMLQALLHCHNQYVAHRDIKLENWLLKPEKSQKKIFKDKCLILEEPVNDIHSLMHFAAITISSGDSMARESCLVGTPSIYTGGRYMDVNEPLIRNGFMKSVASKEELKNAIVESLSGNFSEEVSLQIKKAIKSDWSDTTKIMEDCVTELIETTKSLEGNQ